jgi:hypothetical protein
VLLHARKVGEADIDELNIFVLDELEDFVRSLEHLCSLRICINWLEANMVQRNRGPAQTDGGKTQKSAPAFSSLATVTTLGTRGFPPVSALFPAGYRTP